MDPVLTNEEESLMRWLEEEEDVSGHCATVPPAWHDYRRQAEALGQLIRDGLPHDVPPPDPAAFNAAVLRRLE